MQKKLAAFLFSTRLMGLLFIVYFVAMAVGTFLDQGQETSPTPYSRYWVYNSWWFTSIHILFVINFLGNIFRFKLLRKEKITTLIFHLSFLLILIGAGITRYISYEGVMPITEGQTENTFLSEKTYLEVFIDGETSDEGKLRHTVQYKLDLSPRLNNDFTWNTDFKGDPIKIKFNKFIDGAEDGFVEDETGKWHIKIVETGNDNTRHEHFLIAGEVVNIHNVLYAFNKPTDGAINIGFDGGDNYTFSTPFAGDVTVMATQTKSEVAQDVTQALKLRALYNLGGKLLVIPEPAVRGRTGVVEKENKEKNQEDALFVDVTAQGETKTVGLLGGRGYSNDKKQIEVGGYKMYLSYGSKQLPLPFGIKLNDFIAERYPGTENSYASFESKITVEDSEQPFDYDIYMNHVLDHKGFRFFQASFFPDETGTILSVSHDFWGTWVTYIGYFLMYLGMMMILFDRGSRFGELKKMLDKVKAKKAKLGVIVMMVAFLSTEQVGGKLYAQEINTSAVEVADTIPITQEASEQIISLLPEENNHTQPTREEVDALIVKTAVSKEHAAKFGRMIIQDDSGRMMPINTFSSKLLRKLSRSDRYAGLNADQVMLSMLQNPILWYNAEVIYLKKGNDSIRSIIGVPKDVKRFKAMDFITENLENKLDPYLPDAYAQANPNKIDKEFRDVSERLGLLNRTLGGSILKIFPKPGDINNSWLSYAELPESGYRGMDSLYSKQIIPLYLNSLREAHTTDDYSKADTFLQSIASFQKKFGMDIIPSDKKIDAEIQYNNNDPFKKLYILYMLVSVFLITFVIIEIFYANRFIKLVIKLGIALVALIFVLHTASLIWRWYISGHAPWSDAYESVLYVAWGVMLFGLALSIRKWLYTVKVFNLKRVSKFLIPFLLVPAAVVALGELIVGKKESSLTVGAGAFVTGFLLWAASMYWMNPEIANLQAVLNSYWLMIHTGVIVMSYGPFALGMILGLVSLLLMIFTTEKNKKKMDLNIKELTIINEMALTVGMILLAIGTFLGGQWANESWGRYWGWDPKETWALISLIVYAFVIHMRLIPGLRSKWLFNLSSIIALGSIMFTYFGVNYYLSGLHAYQSGGDIAGSKIIITGGVIALLGVVSYWKYSKYYRKGKRTVN